MYVSLTSDDYKLLAILSKIRNRIEVTSSRNWWETSLCVITRSIKLSCSLSLFRTVELRLLAYHAICL
jgi:hypothetical protein